MLKLQEESEAADLDHQAALDQMESLKKMLDNEVERWYGKYRAKMVALSEMSETLQEVRAGREIARGQAKIWEVKKEYVEDKAAESSNMAEKLAAANERVRLLEIESQEAIAQLGDAAELKKQLEGSLVRVAELEAQLSSRSVEEGGGAADLESEKERGMGMERGNRDPTHTPTTTQQAPTSVDGDEEEMNSVESQASIINQTSLLLQIMAETERFQERLRLLSVSNAVNVPLNNDTNNTAQPPSPITGDSDLDLDAGDPAPSNPPHSREYVLANMTTTDIYNVLQKQYGPNACVEITTVHDPGNTPTDGVDEGNIRAEGPRGGLTIDGYPVVGVPSFIKPTTTNATAQHTSEPTAIQATAVADLRADYTRLQQRYDDLQFRYVAAITSEEAIRQDRYDNHLHYMELLAIGKKRQEDMFRDGNALLKLLYGAPPSNSAAISIVRCSRSSFTTNWAGAFGGLLGSPDREAKDLDTKRLFHQDRICTRDLLANCEQIEGKFMVRMLPSRRDQTTFPATWAWLDQEYGNLCLENSTVDPSTGLDDIRLRLEHSSIWQWPEVKAMTFSWAFYKLLDSVWEDETSSEDKMLELQSKLQGLMYFTIECVPQAMRDRYRIIR